MHRALLRIGFTFASGWGFLTAAVLIVVGLPGSLPLALVLAFGGTLLLGAAVTAILESLVEVARAAVGG